MTLLSVHVHTPSLLRWGGRGGSGEAGEAGETGETGEAGEAGEEATRPPLYGVCACLRGALRAPLYLGSQL